MFRGAAIVHDHIFLPSAEKVIHLAGCQQHAHVVFPFNSGGPQDPQHHHRAGDSTYGTRLDDVVETVREGEVLAGETLFCEFGLYAT